MCTRVCVTVKSWGKIILAPPPLTRRRRSVNWSVNSIPQTSHNVRCPIITEYPGPGSMMKGTVNVTGPHGTRRSSASGSSGSQDFVPDVLLSSPEPCLGMSVSCTSVTSACISSGNASEIAVVPETLSNIIPSDTGRSSRIAGTDRVARPCFARRSKCRRVSRSSIWLGPLPHPCTTFILRYLMFSSGASDPVPRCCSSINTNALAIGLRSWALWLAALRA